jgi:hypothetical protein
MLALSSLTELFDITTDVTLPEITGLDLLEIIGVL